MGMLQRRGTESSGEADVLSCSVSAAGVAKLSSRRRYVRTRSDRKWDSSTGRREHWAGAGTGTSLGSGIFFAVRRATQQSESWAGLK
jgi:hypothetical protein